jgi:CRP-like cAMP-binding protein
MSIQSLLAAANAGLTSAMATPLDIVALCAIGIAIVLVVVSSFVKTMIPLRWLAVGGSFGFLVYGALHPAPIMIVLYGVLLPVHIYRAVEMAKLTRRVTEAAAADDLSGVWLKPYMRTQHLKAGKLLFHKGDVGDQLYFLAEGRIELVEIGETLEPGRLFGELAFFAPDKRRSLSARCTSDCTVLSIDGATFQQLYFQNPAFGFQIVTLVAGRLQADVRRINAQLDESRGGSDAQAPDVASDTLVAKSTN